MVMHTLSKVLLKLVPEPFTLGKQHIPFTAEHYDIVWQRFEHACWRLAGTQPGVREVEGGGLEVGVVEEFGEDGGEVLVCADASRSSLSTGDGVIGRWIERYYASNLYDSVISLCHD